MQDAIEHCFNALSRKDSPKWVLEGDIKGCFDNISHDWMLEHIPMDKEILRKSLKSGFMKDGKLFPTDEGTPQGGTISPLLANMVLDGLEGVLRKQFRIHSKCGKPYNPKVNFVRYADDFIVIGTSKELLEQEVLPIIRNIHGRTRTIPVRRKDGHNSY